MEIVTCPLEGCTAPCRQDHFLCITHWRMVPASLQRDIWLAYRGWKRAMDRYKAARRPEMVSPVTDAAEGLRWAQEQGQAAVMEKLVRKALRASERQAGLGL